MRKGNEVRKAFKDAGFPSCHLKELMIRYEMYAHVGIECEERDLFDLQRTLQTMIALWPSGRAQKILDMAKAELMILSKNSSIVCEIVNHTALGNDIWFIARLVEMAKKRSATDHTWRKNDIPLC